MEQQAAILEIFLAMSRSIMRVASRNLNGAWPSGKATGFGPYSELMVEMWLCDVALKVEFWLSDVELGAADPTSFESSEVRSSMRRGIHC
ncbi:hypothetical protein HAX54_015723 [Datura stramonium]|uniref:Uncharacterized protein n=1 Tax=Datura stramonium TaxID=4076 RepID=A0ABS8UHL5_DATST|nr:hypothetical protein [Datura stramonium]